MRNILLGALRASLVTWVLCGLVYPFALTGLAQWLMPWQANGSLETNPEGVVIGSRLIGQQWKGREWFHGRPSATTQADPQDPDKTVPAPYNAASSAASNLGPASKALLNRMLADRASARTGAACACEQIFAVRHADGIGLRSRPRHQPSERRPASAPRSAGTGHSGGPGRSAGGTARHRPSARNFRRTTRKRLGIESGAATGLPVTVGPAGDKPPCSAAVASGTAVATGPVCWAALLEHDSRRHAHYRSFKCERIS